MKSGTLELARKLDELVENGYGNVWNILADTIDNTHELCLKHKKAINNIETRINQIPKSISLDMEYKERDQEDFFFVLKEHISSILKDYKKEINNTIIKN